jgi:excisionase family DNA binding protein
LALAEHQRRCRRNAITAPEYLFALLASIEDPNGQQRPIPAAGEPISDAQCVDYATAARLLGVSARTVRRMVADGRLGAVRVGRRRVVPVFELRQLPAA